MSDRAAVRFLTFAVLALCLLFLWSEWLHGGEIDDLYARLDAFGRILGDAPTLDGTAPHGDPIAATLRARSDAELDSIARRHA